LIPWNFLPPIDSYINSAAAAAAAAARTAAAAASAAAATAAAAAATAVTAAASAAATATAADTAAAADTTAAAAASAATAATATAAATAVLPLLLPPVAISVQFVEHYCLLDYNIQNSVQLAMTTNLHECMVSCGFVAAARAGVQSASAAAASSGDASGDAVAASSGDASGEAGPSKSAVIFGYIPKEAIQEALQVGFVPVLAWTGSMQHSPHTPTDIGAHIPQTPSVDPATPEVSTAGSLPVSTIVVARSPVVSSESLASTLVVQRSPVDDIGEGSVVAAEDDAIDVDAKAIEEAFESSSLPTSPTPPSAEEEELGVHLPGSERYWKLRGQKNKAPAECEGKSFEELKKDLKKRRKVMKASRSSDYRGGGGHRGGGGRGGGHAGGSSSGFISSSQDANWT
jgi:uncharacterized membrane protein YgcG